MKNQRTINLLAQQLKSVAEMANNLADTIINESDDVIPDSSPNLSQYDAEKYVYGIKGIAELFRVSKVTANIYKSTWLAPAVSQRGKVILTEKSVALKLFAEHNAN